jgi:secreted trypsin-like serine protease
MYSDPGFPSGTRRAVSCGGSRCGCDAKPGVYTRVDQHLGWIDQAMKLPRTRNSLPKPGDADRVP